MIFQTRVPEQVHAVGGVEVGQRRLHPGRVHQRRAPVHRVRVFGQGFGRASSGLPFSIAGNGEPLQQPQPNRVYRGGLRHRVRNFGNWNLNFGHKLVSTS